MNWLLYISGGIITFFWSACLFGGFWHGGEITDESDNTPLIMWLLNFLSWECIWIWTCWKFIS